MTMTEEYKKGVHDTLCGLRLIIEKSSNVVEFETAVKSFVDVTENLTHLADDAPTETPETPEMREMRNNVDDFLKTFAQWKNNTTK